MNNKNNIPVSEIMSTKLKVLHPKDKIQRAKDLFDEYDIHHLPVAVMGKLQGIISLGDILFLEGLVNDSFDEFLKAKKYELSSVDEFMTARPYCVESDTLISEVIDIMIEKRINCLPIKEENELVGIVTNYDIIKYFKTILENNI